LPSFSIFSSIAGVIAAWVFLFCAIAVTTAAPGAGCFAQAILNETSNAHSRAGACRKLLIRFLLGRPRQAA
jgi:hypothetical protein